LCQNGDLQLAITNPATNRAGVRGASLSACENNSPRATALAKPQKPAWFGEPMLGVGFYFTKHFLKIF